MKDYYIVSGDVLRKTLNSLDGASFAKLPDGTYCGKNAIPATALRAILDKGPAKPVAHLHRTQSNMIECIYAGGACPVDGVNIAPQFLDALPFNKSVPLFHAPEES